VSEACPRCFAPLEWHHSSWQCPVCKYKAGCCEGEPQSNDEAGRPGEGRPVFEGGKPFDPEKFADWWTGGYR
jgi:hypothetical protein